MKNLKIRKLGYLASGSVIAIITLMAQTTKIDKIPSDADKIVGIWVSDAKDSRMEIYKSGNTYKGRVIEGWGLKVFEPDGKTPRKDTKNPNVNLRNRPLVNMEFISDLVFKDGEYKNGKLYLAQIGKSVTCKMHFKEDKLIMRGYVVSSILGMTKKWTRVTE